MVSPFAIWEPRNANYGVLDCGWCNKDITDRKAIVVNGHVVHGKCIIEALGRTIATEFPELCEEGG